MVNQLITNRLRGITIGAVAGDALGMPLEFQQPRPVHQLETEMRNGALPAGTFTDDTEMALALAESLLFTNPLDPRDLAARFVGWYQLGPSDIGVHTTKVLRQIATGKTWQQATRKVQEFEPENASNGSLMRCWPVVIARWNNPSLMAAEAGLQSQVTHLHADCVNACMLFSLILHKLIHRDAGTPANAAIRQAVSSSAEQVELSSELRKAVILAPVRSREELPNTGWVLHTIESALWAVMTTQSFEEALVQAVNLGHDADTTGTVAGAIAGALYGVDAIPIRWKEVIHGEYPIKSGKLWFLKDFIKLADDLVAFGS
jgi:ADP-ribosyl-[dinitrogen reductase] hydrolase